MSCWVKSAAIEIHWAWHDCDSGSDFAVNRPIETEAHIYCLIQTDASINRVIQEGR